MSNDVSVAKNTAVAFPANLAALFAGKNNINQHESINQVSFKGKVFSVHADGNVKQLLDEDGNALPMIEVVILNANPRRSRTYFAGAFDGEGKAPDCHSYLGKVPASSVEEPISSSCETCEMSVKGSRVNDKGQAVTACQLRQRIVVVPSDKLDFTALLINMASTSAFDKDNPDSAKGWYAFDQYKAELGKRGIPHTAAVKTKVRFAPSDAFPRLQFRFSGLLDEDEVQQVLPRIESEEVMLLLNADHGKQQGEVKVIAAPVAKPKPVQVVEDEPDDTPAPTTKAEAKPKPVAKPKPAPVAEEEAEEEAEEAPAPKPAPKAEKAKPVVVEEGEDISSVLSSWD